MESCRRYSSEDDEEVGRHALPEEVDVALSNACREGHRQSCLRRVERALPTMTEDRDGVRAMIPLYQAACATYDERACLVVRALSTLPEEKLPMHEVAMCLRGLPVECEVAADRLAADLRRLRAPYPGLALRELACVHGLRWSCHVAALSWLDAGRAHGVLSNTDYETRAAELYTKACDMGRAASCCQAAEIRVRSTRGNANPTEARRLLTRAGSSADTYLCEALRGDPRLASPPR